MDVPRALIGVISPCCTVPDDAYRLLELLPARACESGNIVNRDERVDITADDWIAPYPFCQKLRLSVSGGVVLVWHDRADTAMVREILGEMARI